MEYLTSGYRGDVEKLINKAIFEQAMNNMIIGRDIEIYSLSEEHAVRIASASALFGNARLISTHQGSAARDIGDGAKRQPRWRTTLNKVSLLTDSIRRRAKLGAGSPPRTTPRWWTRPNREEPLFHVDSRTSGSSGSSGQD